MKKTELRIGNIVGMDILNVFPPNFIAGIKSVVLSAIRDKDFDPVYMFCPVPLTEQWLKDFGFKKSLRTWRKFGCIFHITQYGKFFINKLNLEIKYVHQLQNLYFALTGNELIKN